MKKLFYINHDNYNISKLSEFYSEQDKVVIFTLSYSDKLKWGDKYPVYYYTDIGINAQNGIFNGLLEESYKLTYRIIDIGINKFELTAERRNLLKALPSKIHRVVSEALRAEKVIDEIIKYFKPDKIYFLKPQRNIHKKNKYQITAKINFENEVLLSRCSKENIVHQFLPIFQINRLGYLKNTFK